MSLLPATPGLAREAGQCMRTWSNLIDGLGWQRAARLSSGVPASAACVPAGHVGRLGVSQLAASTVSRLMTTSGSMTARRRTRWRRPGICSVPGMASCRVSLVNTANRNPRPGSSDTSVCSIRSSARWRQAGRLIMTPARIQPPCRIARPRRWR